MFRRAFLSRLSAAAALLELPQAAPAAPTRSTAPARHPQDAWFDQAPATHRAVFDSWMADRFGETVAFAGNWLRINKQQYGLTDADLAVVIVARHGTGPFAFDETVWTKYGRIFADHMSTTDPVAHPNPSTNPHAARLAALARQGVRLAVCNLTTRAYAGMIAKDTGAAEDAVYRELTTHAIGDAHFVPAGIVAVTRAQEHGYAYVSIG